MYKDGDRANEGEISVHRNLDDSEDTITLSSQTGQEVDELALARALSRIPGIESIKLLTVQFDSMVKNLRFLEAVPGLETLQLNGRQLQSLDGLEWFSRGRVIGIDTERNRSRNTEKISTTRIGVLIMGWANAGDLETIGRTTTLRRLNLSRCPALSFHQWRDVPLETIQLFGGSIEELGDTSVLGNLRKLTLAVHRKLQRFVGDNSNVKELIIQKCYALDVNTLSTFRNLVSLIVTDFKKELPLSTFAGFPRLRKLWLIQCKVVLDKLDLKSTAPDLEDLHILKLPKDRLMELSHANPDVRVSSGDWQCRNGRLEAT
jgi:hypothetical protein